VGVSLYGFLKSVPQDKKNIKENKTNFCFIRIKIPCLVLVDQYFFSSTLIEKIEKRHRLKA